MKYNDIANNELPGTILTELTFLHIEVVIISEEFDEIIIFSQYAPLNISHF
jgi:hypothetical protein